MIDELKVELRSVGLEFLTPDANYVDAETGFLPPPKRHLLAMLKAVEQQLRLRDRQTAREAFASIREVNRGAVFETARVELPRDEASATDQLDIGGDDVDLSNVRGLLAALTADLAEEPETDT